MANSFRDLRGAVEKAILPEILDKVGRYMVGRLKSAFNEQRRGNRSWQARSVPNRAGIIRDLAAGRMIANRRYESRPAGIDTGSLKRSVTYQVERNAVLFGSELPYAQRFHDGGSETLPITPAMKKRISAMLRNAGNDRRLRTALGPLLRRSEWDVKTPPRPLFTVTPAERREIEVLVQRETDAALAREGSK